MDTEELAKTISIAILIVSIILFIAPKYHKYKKRHAEWMQKVNNCVMNPNYRPDCKLILYKDQQNAGKNSSTTTIMPMPMYIHR